MHKVRDLFRGMQRPPGKEKKPGGHLRLAHESEWGKSQDKPTNNSPRRHRPRKQDPHAWRAPPPAGRTIDPMPIDEAITSLTRQLDLLTHPHMGNAHATYNQLLRHMPANAVILDGPPLRHIKGRTTVVADAFNECRIVPHGDMCRHDGRPLWFEAHINWDSDGLVTTSVISCVRTMGGRQVPQTSLARTQLASSLGQAMPAWIDMHLTELDEVKAGEIARQVRNQITMLNIRIGQVTSCVEAIADGLSEVGCPQPARRLYRQFRRNGIDPWEASELATALT